MNGIQFGQILTGVTSGSSAIIGPNQQGGVKTFHAVHYASSIVTSTIGVWGSNLPTAPTRMGEFALLGTISISGSSGVAGDALVVEAPYKWHIVSVITASGAGSAVYVYMGNQG